MQIYMYVYFLYTKNIYIHFFYKLPIVAKFQKLPKTLCEQKIGIFHQMNFTHIPPLLTFSHEVEHCNSNITQLDKHGKLKIGFFHSNIFKLKGKI